MAETPHYPPVSLHPHWGHSPLLTALARARLQDSLPAALLIHGSRGVGKQHLALWLARLLLCEAPGPRGPCEECSSCSQAGKLEHPDLHWYFPLPRPKGASTPEKLAVALEEARWEVLSELRANPLRPSVGGEPRSLYLAAARTLRRQAQRRPSSGDRQVFLIGEAEALAPQESSSEAANSLLKLLEEPPSGTILILTSSEPGRLLPTIRSRTTALHLPPRSQEEVTDFLIRVAKVEEAEAARVAAISHGAIGRALGFLREGEDLGPLEETRKGAFRLLSAALAPTPGPAFQEAASFKPVGARGLFELLDFLEEWIRDLALAASQPHMSGEKGTQRGAQRGAQPGVFKDVLARWKFHPATVAGVVKKIDAAREMAAGNVNPQLVIFGLLHDIREELVSRTPTTGPRRNDGQRP